MKRNKSCVGDKCRTTATAVISGAGTVSRHHNRGPWNKNEIPKGKRGLLQTLGTTTVALKTSPKIENSSFQGRWLGPLMDESVWWKTPKQIENSSFQHSD